MGASKNKGTPKWMVYNMENPPKQEDDLGGKPTIFGNTHMDETKTMAIYHTLRRIHGLNTHP